MTDNAQTINMQDNRTVVGLLRAGDEKCFDALFRRYYKPLCTYATRFVTPARAEELVQDTLMWVWENRTSLLPEDGQLPYRADRAPAAPRAERVLAARRFAVVAGPALKKYRKFPIFFEFRLASSADGLYYYID